MVYSPVIGSAYQLVDKKKKKNMYKKSAPQEVPLILDAFHL